MLEYIEDDNLNRVRARGGDREGYGVRGVISSNKLVSANRKRRGKVKRKVHTRAGAGLIFVAVFTSSMSNN